MNLESLFHVAFCRRSLHTHLTAGWTSTYYELQSNFIIVKLSELSVVTQDKKKQPSTGNTRPVHTGLVYISTHHKKKKKKKHFIFAVNAPL